MTDKTRVHFSPFNWIHKNHDRHYLYYHMNNAIIASALERPDLLAHWQILMVINPAAE